MKTELDKYNSIVKSITPNTGNGKDAFSLGGFWRANEFEIPAFSYVLRAVLAHSPNSVPPERVFSILNNTFDADQDASRADYIELALQLQFNNRSRSNADAV